MTEENERPGIAGAPGVPPAGGPGALSAPAVPPAVPPKPPAPPTPATPVAPPAMPPTSPPTLPATPLKPPASPSVPPASRAGSRQPGRAPQLGGWARRQSSARIGAAVAAFVVVGLLIWGVTSLGGAPQPPVADAAPAAATPSAAPASRGTLPLEGVGPLDFQLGDCFKDFDPEAQQSTIVDCATGHSAQLIATHHYPASDAYPGLTALKDKGRETCRNAQLAAAATTYTLLQRNAYPSSSSWDNGDRRVDCYVTTDAGNVIMETLVP